MVERISARVLPRFPVDRVSREENSRDVLQRELPGERSLPARDVVSSNIVVDVTRLRATYRPIEKPRFILCTSRYVKITCNLFLAERSGGRF